jgi:hypothetical protein
MINPTVTEAVAAERIADLRREAARYRASQTGVVARKVKAVVPPQAERLIAAAADSQPGCEVASSVQPPRHKIAA